MTAEPHTPEMCRWIRATIPLLEVLAEHEPKRRTLEHAANGRAILATGGERSRDA